MNNLKIEMLEGELTKSQNYKVGVIVSRFNTSITNSLLEGAKIAISDHNSILSACVFVPGAFELSLVAKKMAASGDYDALVVLGCVIRGETSHYDYVCLGVTQGINQVGLDYEIPIGFGVLTTENRDQAISRSKEGPDNKGYEVTITALKMVDVLKKLS